MAKGLPGLGIRWVERVFVSGEGCLGVHINGLQFYCKSSSSLSRFRKLVAQLGCCNLKELVDSISFDSFCSL